MTVEELVQRLYTRYTAHFDSARRQRVDDLVMNDAPTALIRFITVGLERRDLQPDEVDAALELAENGRLLKSSAHLRDELSAYRRDHAAV